MVLSPFCIFILNYELGEHIVLRGPTPYSLPFCILLFWGHIEYYPGLLPTSDEQAVLTINKTTDSTLTMKFRGTDKTLQWINSCLFKYRSMWSLFLLN